MVGKNFRHRRRVGFFNIKNKEQIEWSKQHLKIYTMVMTSVGTDVWLTAFNNLFIESVMNTRTN